MVLLVTIHDEGGISAEAIQSLEKLLGSEVEHAEYFTGDAREIPRIVHFAVNMSKKHLFDVVGKLIFDRGLTVTLQLAS